MTFRIVIELPGEPKGKARLRYRVVRSYKNPKGFASGYTPKETTAYEGRLRFAGYRAMRERELLTGSLCITLYAYFKMPKDWNDRKRSSGERGEIRPTKKPDWDNVAKMTDALNGVVWKDDAQIVDGGVHKFWSDNPRLVVIVSPAQQSEDLLPCSTGHTTEKAA